MDILYSRNKALTEYAVGVPLYVQHVQKIHIHTQYNTRRTLKSLFLSSSSGPAIYIQKQFISKSSMYVVIDHSI